MNFFVDEKKRKASHSTCYFEFQKGRHQGDQYWLPDSISISDTLWDRYHISDLIRSVIKNFDYYGPTAVTKNQWDEIMKLSQEAGGAWAQITAEAAPWVKECFKKQDVFTIMGI